MFCDIYVNCAFDHQFYIMSISITPQIISINQYIMNLRCDYNNCLQNRINLMKKRQLQQNKDKQKSLINLTMGYLNKNSYLVGLKKIVTNHRKNNLIKNNAKHKKSLSVNNLVKGNSQDDVHNIYDSPLPKIYSSLSIQQSSSKIYSMQNKIQPLQQSKLVDHKYLFLGFNISQVMGQSRPPTGRQSQRYDSKESKQCKLQLRKRRLHNQENRNKAKSLTKMEISKIQNFGQLKRNLSIGNQIFKLIPVKMDKNSSNSGSHFLAGTKNTSVRKNKQKLKNSNINDEVSAYRQLTKQLEKFSIDQSLLKRLGEIANDYNKDTIRIYKQDFSKIYAARYGKDKLTCFFDYEYIQDFDSLRKIIDTIIHLNSNQILLLSFLVLDYDCDGVISHSDIFSILTLAEENQLIKKDLYKLIKYVNNQHQTSNWVKDSCDFDYLKKDAFTLAKYRFMIYMEQKNPTPKAIDKKQKSKITVNLQKHLFTFNKQQDHQNKKIDLFKQFLNYFIKGQKQAFPEHKTFKINLTRFKNIFDKSPPSIYLDILYTLASIQLKEQKYQKLNINVLLKPKKIIKFQEISRYQKTMKIYRHLKKNYNIPYFKNQNIRAKVKPVL